MSLKLQLWKMLGERMGYPFKNTPEYNKKVEEYKIGLARLEPDIEVPADCKPAQQATYVCDRCGYCPGGGNRHDSIQSKSVPTHKKYDSDDDDEDLARLKKEAADDLVRLKREAAANVKHFQSRTTVAHGCSYDHSYSDSEEDKKCNVGKLQSLQSKPVKKPHYSSSDTNSDSEQERIISRKKKSKKKKKVSEQPRRTVRNYSSDSASESDEEIKVVKRKPAVKKEVIPVVTKKATKKPSKKEPTKKEAAKKKQPTSRK